MDSLKNEQLESVQVYAHMKAACPAPYTKQIFFTVNTGEIEQSISTIQGISSMPH